MTAQLKRRKVEDGAYEIVNRAGYRVAMVEEQGKSGYRWRVTPSDRSARGWDTNSLAAAVDTLGRMPPYEPTGREIHERALAEGDARPDSAASRLRATLTPRRAAHDHPAVADPLFPRGDRPMCSACGERPVYLAGLCSRCYAAEGERARSAPVLYRVAVQSSSFLFEAYGRTEAEARATFGRLIAVHVRRAGAEQAWAETAIADAVAYAIRPGEAAIDGELVEL